MKWEIPFSFGCSSLEPVTTHTPIETDFRYGISSVMTRIPFGRTVFRYPQLEDLELKSWVLEESRFIISLPSCLFRLLGHFSKGRFSAQPDTTLGIDIDHLDHDIITLLENVRNLFHMAFR